MSNIASEWRVFVTAVVNPCVAESSNEPINWIAAVPCRKVSVPAVPLERVPWCRYFPGVGIYVRSFRGFTQFCQWHSGIIVKLGLNRHLPHAFQFNTHLSSYDPTSLTASLNERIRGFCTLESDMHRFETVLRVMCYFDSVLTWLSSKGGQRECVCAFYCRAAPAGSSACFLW